MSSRSEEEQDLLEFLVFGGMGEDGGYLDTSFILSTSLSNFEASEVHKLKRDSENVLLGTGDAFRNNQFFGVSAEPFATGAHKTLCARQRKELKDAKSPASQLVGIVGEGTLHVLNVSQREWIACIEELGTDK